MVKVAEDGSGLPVVHWMEGSMLQRQFRTSFILRDGGSGEMSFVHERVDEPSGLLGILVGIAVGIGTVVAVALPIIFIADAMRLRAGTALDVATALVYLVGIGAGVVVGRKAKDWFARKGHGRTVQRQSAPWAALEAFTVTDDQTYFGKARQKDGKPVQPKTVILAHFGSLAAPICVSHDSWAQSVVGDIHRTLTQEFIARRSAHVERLQSARRDAQPAVERPKMI